MRLLRRDERAPGRQPTRRNCSRHGIAELCAASDVYACTDGGHAYVPSEHTLQLQKIILNNSTPSIPILIVAVEL